MPAFLPFFSWGLVRKANKEREKGSERGTDGMCHRLLRSGRDSLLDANLRTSHLHAWPTAISLAHVYTRPAVLKELLPRVLPALSLATRDVKTTDSDSSNVS